MRNLAIFLLFALALTSCKKQKSGAVLPNTDATGSIFRLVANSDVEYRVSIIISGSGNAIPDTLSIASPANFEFNYGFKAETGAVIQVVAATNAGATTLQFVPEYKSAILGPVTFTTNADNSKYAAFTYTVTQ